MGQNVTPERTLLIIVLIFQPQCRPRESWRVSCSPYYIVFTTSVLKWTNISSWQMRSISIQNSFLTWWFLVMRIRKGPCKKSRGQFNVSSADLPGEALSFQMGTSTTRAANHGSLSREADSGVCITKSAAEWCHTFPHLLNKESWLRTLWLWDSVYWILSCSMRRIL